jgi:molecular chaperone GrpE
VPLRTVPRVVEPPLQEREPAAEERAPAPAPAEPAASDDLARLAARLEARQQEELDKTKERLEREARREVELAHGKLLRDLLEVIDDLDRALASAATSPDALTAGVAMVRDRFLDKLRAHGVEPSDDAGSRFDPAKHEAVTTVPVTDPEQDGKVVVVLRPGYRLRGELLRPAAVAVGRLAVE